jgi:hypothetical protein
MHVRVSPAEYMGLPLRAHELLRDVQLYDVSAMDLPGGGVGRSVAEVQAVAAAVPPSRVADAIYGVRHGLGRVFGWDRVPIEPTDSLVSHLSERDRRESQVTPGTRDGAFRIVYRFPNEQLSETRNGTVQGYICVALAPTATGYRLYWGIYVIPVSWVTRPYLLAIEPVRRFILYPAMLRRIRRAWRQAYN